MAGRAGRWRPQLRWLLPFQGSRRGENLRRVPPRGCPPALAGQAGCRADPDHLPGLQRCLFQEQAAESGPPTVVARPAVASTTTGRRRCSTTLATQKPQVPQRHLLTVGLALVAHHIHQPHLHLQQQGPHLVEPPRPPRTRRPRCSGCPQLGCAEPVRQLVRPVGSSFAPPPDLMAVRWPSRAARRPAAHRQCDLRHRAGRKRPAHPGPRR